MEKQKDQCNQKKSRLAVDYESGEQDKNEDISSSVPKMAILKPWSSAPTVEARKSSRL